MPLSATVRYWSGEQSFAAPKGLPSDHPFFPMRMDPEPMTNEAAALGNQVLELLCGDGLSPVEKRDFFRFVTGPLFGGLVAAVHGARGVFKLGGPRRTAALTPARAPRVGHQPPRKESLTEQAYAQIEEAIIRHRPHAIREAIQRLAREHLIVILPQRSLLVPEIDCSA